MPEFTLVSTVFNEIRRIDDTIMDIEFQSVKPAEIIITDAGSNDGTFERLLKWKNESKLTITVLQSKGCNVAEGRNMAIKNSKYNLIASTDFGCRFHPEWLSSIILPFRNPEVKVVGGNFTVVERDITTMAAKASYLLSAGYNILLNSDFIPSSRSIAYYKEVWDETGGYPEWLTLAADDLVFGKIIKNKGYQIYLSPEPYVYWGRHTNALAYGKEAFRYGMGDGEAGVNFRNFMSKIIETSLRYFLFISILSCITFFLFGASKLIFLLPVFFLPGLRSYTHAFRLWLSFKSKKYDFKVLLYSFYIIELTRIKYIQGYYKGYFKRTAKQRAEAAKLKLILV